MIKIMVVDDEADLRLMVKKRLESLQFTVIEAEDGLDALDKAKTYRPDIIILDIFMPRMDGYRFLEELRKSDSKAKFARVIVLSARRKMKDAFDPRHIVKFIGKPFDAQELLDTVKEVASQLKTVKRNIQRAMIVGLDWDVMRPMKELLETRDFLVFTAKDGPQALELGVERKPDLIFCSSVLAGMDVFQLCKLFKDLSRTKDVPFIVFDTAGHLGRSADTLDAAAVIDYKGHEDLVTSIDQYLTEHFFTS